MSPRKLTRAAAVPLAIAAAVALSGCSAPPPRDDLVERFLIELETESLGKDHPYNLELAEVMADDALEGECGADEYWKGLMMAPPSRKQYAWAATCSSYFGSDMTDEQIQQSKELILQAAMDGMEEPEPEPAATQAPPPSPAATPVTLTDGQRATLDATFGRSLGSDGPLGTYCPMDEAGRSYYADLVARQFDGYTPQIVLAYLEEACVS
ncbi:hypothetical protein [Agromyces sp. SYSU T0242]|uniref:hypothetical protein n=1 Tax=Agromyces litoreus TaxID=3158561 RepID=UPI0033990435